MESSLTDLLQQYESGALDAGALATRWRATLADGGVRLPERFEQVLGQLLSSVESAALFTEESCSFSREDLGGQLRLWLQAAVKRGVLDGA